MENTEKGLPSLRYKGSRGNVKWYAILFFASFLGMMAAFLPTMIKNGGIFLYYGDFNSQQEMFYYHANEVVRSGAYGWDWGTDLGTDFIGSYSFYLLGSPFFWLTTLFPISAVKYLIPWLIALKTGVAAMTAFAYIKRFVISPEACCAGAFLYAFSGFQMYNVFFNHFHDVTAFFPLLLLSFEQLTQDRRRGVFALSVALAASISYFFFVCEVVFLIIYFFIRSMDDEFRMDMRIFGSLCAESVIGVAISCAILMPAVYDVLTNPRLRGRLFGNDILFYSESVRIPRIIQSFFMFPDMPARVNILKSDNGRWASIAGYLPLFSMTGVIAYIRGKRAEKKTDFAVRLVIVSGIMMCVPILNAAFVAFNSSYYARWYFMPILIMCLMTARVVDRDPELLKKGYIISTAIGAFFLCIGLLPKRIDGEVVYGKNYQYKDLYLRQFLVTAVFAAVLGILIYIMPKSRLFGKVTAFFTAVCCFIMMFAGVNFGAVQDGGHDKYIEHAINGRENLDMERLGQMSAVNDLHPDNTFFRIDTSENVDNWCMFWGLSSMRTFHSVVSPSIMDMYSAIGQTRDVASRMEPKLYPLRSMFSVRYYFRRCGSDKQQHTDSVPGLYGFTYLDTQNDFDIYENMFWVPMGFTYDQYTTRKVIDDTEKDLRPNVMMEAVVLDEEQAQKYADILTEYDSDMADTSEVHFAEVCNEKRESSCYSFEYGSGGFDAKIKLSQDKLVFFSVPYSNGWTAEVNGVRTDIERVNFGLMAVRCPAGDSEIRFTYKTPWLTEGRLVTILGVSALLIYCGYFIFEKRKKDGSTPDTPADNEETAEG